MNTRILITRKGCPHCRKMLKVINRVNLDLPIEKRINIVDAWEYEEFDLHNIPLIDKMLRMIKEQYLEQGFPLLFIDGIIIEPAPTEEMLRNLLEEFLKGDLLY